MSDITKAIQVLCEEKNLSYESVMEAIEFALAAAYRKDFGNKQQNIKVKFDPEKGDMKAWDVKTVVEDIAEDALLVAQEELTKRREKAKEEKRELTEEETEDLPRFNPKTELMLSAAKEIDKKVKVGEVMEIPLEIQHEFGRMAAQTAKQVIIQKIREAERGIMFNDFKGQEGQLVMGTIQRAEARKVLVDFGKVTGVLLAEHQNSRDHYRPGARMKFLLLSVQMTPRGLEVLLSRSDVAMVREIFKQEIPEISDGLIEIKGIAREAGFRSKVAVFTTDKAIDPIGSCIGQKGSRINTIIEELGGEKIDIIQYSEDAKEYIAHALAPAKILNVKLNESDKIAEVGVAPDQFSLAIGRNGQNVRLAANLTGWRIDVVEEGGSEKLSSDEVKPEAVEVAEEVEEKKEE
ncbi:MAG: transcription termination factor NusA [Candidatus Magasanikbacteria bacterium RIFOXYD2_FULL_39_9]|uniref:Transcription termination/antitermination protein NusA n=1 Tax=Candidatus Magasanikbacteria bacterium RIFOXYD1_FULL_40_23 TaxID=1798705 RepID=A0A1F6P9D8_9BACT|nr:MAG: transcription termination factor NusA [Candidatus Magasanikbacteria bacterium RIFOXYD1_FULL_40_23]OGH93513.1 MAG: transcription termination factor NusA [Candidatus Magasanikbacteria bacterium RIFOXYD2_FULL_39_9]